MAIKKHIWNPFIDHHNGTKTRTCWACGLHHKQVWAQPIPLHFYRTGMHANWERHMRVPKTCVEKFPLWHWEFNPSLQLVLLYGAPHDRT